KVLGPLAGENPNLSQVHDDLARGHFVLGELQFQARQFPAALASYQAAAKIWQKLTDTHPSVLIFHTRLADAHAGQANVWSAEGQMDKAVEASRQALDVQQKLTGKDAAAPKYRGDL